MIDYETFVRIRNYLDRDGLKYTQISDSLGIDQRTVAKWANEKRYQPRKSSSRKSKLDPFKDDILRMLEKHPYSGMQIFQRLKENGFDGGKTIVQDYVKKVRPSKTKAFLKLVFAPGECAQVDWGSYGSVRVGSTNRRLSFFVMVLCHSRMMYTEFTVSQTMEHFLGCHQNAFHYFGVVPQKIMVDNLKSAVLRRIVGKSPVFNPRYLDFADHYGFSIVPCNVGKGNEKGQVENGVKYVKQNLLNGLDIPDFSMMKPASKHWLETIANVRNHRETGEKPIDMFQEEKCHLNPLPIEPYDIGVVKQKRTSKQFRITIDTNRYSVPAQLAGVRLTVKLYPDRVCFYHENKLVARHARSYDRRKDFEHPDHPKALLAQRRKAKEQKIYMQFLSLSEKAQDYYRQLEQRRMNPFHHIQKIVSLSEIYSKEQVQMAIEDAFIFSAFSCEYIANILEQRTRPHKEPGALHLTRNSDLLELSIDQRDLSIYNKIIEGDENE
jgi:transposase